MEAIKDFDDFFRLKIEPLLPELEQEDKSIIHWRNAAIISGAILLFFIAGGIFKFLDDASLFPITLTAGGIAIISLYNYIVKDNNYVDKYKATIIQSVISYLNPGLEYKPDITIPEKEYRQSGLYRHNYDYYDGGDLIKGIYKNVSFHCSELRTMYDNLGGPQGNQRVKIFKGLFFSAVVNKNFTGGTYVWIREREQLAVSIADEEYRLLPFPETSHYHTGNVLFESVFSVYTTSKAQAATVLNTEMQQLLLKFRSQIQRNFVFSVVMGKCYVAIPVKEDLFEPADNPDDKEEIKKYFFSVLLILSIINQLQLAKLQ